MQIPNYDTHFQEKTNLRQLYLFMPKNIFRMLICGNTGCGKTNLSIHMLLTPLLYYDKIYLYAKNLEQDKYPTLISALEPMSKVSGYPIIEYSNEGILPVNELPDNRPGSQQTIVICDDYVCEKNEKDLVDYFIQGRHKNASVVYL